MEAKNKKPEDIELTDQEEEALKNIKANLKTKLEAAEAEKAERAAEAEKPEKESEVTEEPGILMGRAAEDGVAVKTKDLVNATEEYPIVLLINADFEPVKKGDEVRTPFDAVLKMDEIQVVGPMIRVIIRPERGYNIES